MTNNRQKTNKALVKAISDFLDSNPEQRFNQALINLDVTTYENNIEDIEIDACGHEVVNYYEEPSDTLARVKKAIKRMETNE